MVERNCVPELVRGDASHVVIVRSGGASSRTPSLPPGALSDDMTAATLPPTPNRFQLLSMAHALPFCHSRSSRMMSIAYFRVVVVMKTRASPSAFHQSRFRRHRAGGIVALGDDG